ncbi:hypothetical protein CBP27_04840 [Fischerella thermalis WC542]|nr:hypothetical protein CBP19_21835 [Fischerella thermalis WC1110]PLZ11218.1 hypothetical protein CBP18_09225 [Fischerella thermalis WC119]PLZ28428.1 hypothetical protein CBP29_02035 [Fischerella thermalis WC341]PLZ33498.1 hypothetical protein CBP28_03565 [Fischerella thermalis WC559]PLZ34901.1 hypothetical protein CBP10_04650 [Fischerella thermalis WC558]PLZ41733.1 hypothetical protein CBP26_08905 [Fischerella thermalis WC538]PLZ41991.1 hypothetical protein CBP27_04840 [Fischerella thermalis
MPSISLDGFYLDQPHVEFLLMVRIEEIKGGGGKVKRKILIQNYSLLSPSLIPYPLPPIPTADQ